MSVKHFLTISSSIIFLFAVSCSDSDSAGTGATSNLNELSTAVVAVKNNVAKASVFSTASTSAVTQKVAGDWTDTVLTDLGGEDCNSTDTPKGLLEEMTSGDCTVSPIFDLNNMLDMMCVITTELEITDGLPDTGTQSITISAATGSSCGVADAVGFELDVVVANTASQTTYQRVATFTAGAGERQILVGSSGDATNIAFTYQEGTTSAYRGYYTSDTGTDITRFELQSLSTQGTANTTFFRVYIDESESPGEVTAVGTRNDEGNGGLFSRWTFKAPLDASDEYGVTLAFGGHGGGGTSPLETCVDPSSDFSASGVTANNCGTDGYTAPGVVAFSGTAQTYFGATGGLTLQQFIDELDDTDAITWSDADINTAAAL